MNNWSYEFKFRCEVNYKLPYIKSVFINMATMWNFRLRTYTVKQTESCWNKWLFRSSNKNVKWSRYRPGVAQRVGRVIAQLFHDRGTRRGWVVSSTPRPHFTPGKYPVPIVQEAGWGTRAGLDRCGKSRPHRRKSNNKASKYSIFRTRKPCSREWKFVHSVRNLLCCFVTVSCKVTSVVSHTGYPFQGHCHAVKIGLSFSNIFTHLWTTLITNPQFEAYLFLTNWYLVDWSRNSLHSPPPLLLLLLLLLALQSLVEPSLFLFCNLLNKTYF